MKNHKVERIQQKVLMLKRQFLQGERGLFDQALSDHEVAAIVGVGELIPPHRERIYTPLDTLRLFVGQVLSTDRACQDVVGRRLSERIAQGLSVSALNTSAYCDARQRLPIQLPETLGAKLAERLELTAPSAWRWQGSSCQAI